MDSHWKVLSVCSWPCCHHITKGKWAPSSTWQMKGAQRSFWQEKICTPRHLRCQTNHTDIDWKEWYPPTFLSKISAYFFSPLELKNMVDFRITPFYLFIYLFVVVAHILVDLQLERKIIYFFVYSRGGLIWIYSMHFL